MEQARRGHAIMQKKVQTSYNMRYVDDCARMCVIGCWPKSAR
jgi:hypothetical protein